MTAKNRTIDITYQGLTIDIEGDFTEDGFQNVKVSLAGFDLDAIIDEDVKAEIITLADAEYRQYIQDQATDRRVDQALEDRRERSACAT